MCAFISPPDSHIQAPLMGLEQQAANTTPSLPPSAISFVQMLSSSQYKGCTNISTRLASVPVYSTG